MLINLTLPVFNEAGCLEGNALAALGCLKGLGLRYELVIADNGSTDGTLGIARRLAREYVGVRCAAVELVGRGGALKAAWGGSDADVFSYMDIDLSTDLGCYAGLIGRIVEGGDDVVVGSRLMAGSVVRRGWRREVISRGYAWLARGFTGVPVRDFQCGFKAIRGTVARVLLSEVEDVGWFFDTELLVLAYRGGFRIGEAPVRWREGSDSNVRLLRTAMSDLWGLVRMRRRGKGGR